MKTLFPRSRAMLRACVLLMGLLGAATTAHAACGSPVGTAGDMTYSTSANVMVYCDGSNWISMAGGVSLTVNTSGGGATPAGSTNDIQFNSSGALAADTGNFTYTTASGLLKVTNISATAITGTTETMSGLGTYGSILDNGGLTVLGASSMTTVSATAISGTLIQAGASTATCAAGLNGAIRYNSTSNTIQVCAGTVWTSLASGTTSGVTGGTANYGAIFSGATTLTTDTALYVDTTNHRVGIGTNTPQAGLDLNNGLMIHGSASYATSDSGLEILKINNSLGTISMINGPDRTERELRFYGSPMTFYTGGVERMRIVSVTGNVGIGTASPLAALHVSGTGGSSNSLVVEATSSGTNTSPRIGFIDTALGTASTAPVWYVDNSHDTFRIFRQPSYNTGGSLFFSVSNTGNVAIGSNNPIAKLDVNGTISSSNAIQVGTSTLTCSNGISGSLRYNTTSNTMDYCSGSAWLSLGPSATVVPSFVVTKGNTNQTVTTGQNTKVSWTTIEYDTNNNFSTGTGRYTPSVPGKYLFNFECSGNTSSSSGAIVGSVMKNGGAVTRVGDVVRSPAAGTTNLGSNATALFDMNGTTDYVETYCYLDGTTISGAVGSTYFQGILISMAGGGSGGGATPAGSTNDIQFNSSGALAADTGNFTYTTSGGLLKVTNVSLTALTGATASFTGQGTFGSLLVNGGATVTGQASITTVSSTLIQLSNNSTATCTAGLAGAQRYNSVSNTIDYCSGSAWLSLGPSATQPIAFSVTKGGTAQTVTANTWSKVTWSTKEQDTNNNFSACTTGCASGAQTATESRFTATVPGKYLIYAAVNCATGTTCAAAIFKNGSEVRENPVYATTNQVPNVSAIVNMAAGDYVEAQGYSSSGSFSGSIATSNFSGVLLASQGGGSGAATPAGSTADVQYNSGGALAADTGNFTYASSVLKAPSISATNISGTLIQAGASTATCAVGLNGAMRYNSTSNTLQICVGSVWTSLSSSTMAGSGVTGGTANYGAVFSGATTLTTDTALYVDTTNHRLGIGTSAVSSTVTAMVATSASIADVYAGNGSNGSFARMGAFGNGGAITVGDSSGTTQGIIRAYAIGGTQAYFTAGNVGIGTTIANASLTVVGEVQVSNSGATCASATNGGAIRYSGGTLYYCNGSNTWAALASGGTPAGSTGDIQYNNGGAFAADTGQLYWDATNNRLGIGTGSPGYPLTVSADIALSQTGGTHSPQLTWLVNGTRQGYMGWGTTGSDFDIFADNGNNLALITTGASAPIVFYPSSTERMRITPAGNIGIGTSAPGYILDVSGTVRSRASSVNPYGFIMSNYTGANGAFVADTVITGNSLINYLGTYQNVPLAIFTSNTERMRIDGSGNVGIGTTNPGSPLTVSGTGQIRVLGSSARMTFEPAGGYTMNLWNIDNDAGTGNMRFFTENYASSGTGAGGVVRMTLTSASALTVSGNVTAPAFLYSSDKRLKSDITDLTGGVAKLDALNPVSFRFTADPSKTIHLGLLAQDVQKVYPEAVKSNDKGYLALDYPSLIGPIVDMLKEMKEIVFGDHAELLKLRTANDNMMSTIAALRKDNDGIMHEVDTLRAANANLLGRMETLEGKMRVAR